MPYSVARGIVLAPVPPLPIIPDPSSDPALRARAESLAHELASTTTTDLALFVTPHRLELRVPDERLGAVFVDPDAVDPQTLRGGNKRQLIARAVGLGGAWEGGKAPRVLDCSAGLLGDAMLLSALGCEVVAVERSAVLHAMQRDALDRLRTNLDDDKAAMAARIALVHAQAATAFAALADGPPLDAHGRADWRPEAIYFDPMHPERRKSALVKKEMRILRRLVGDDPDAGAVLRAALAVPGVRRVIVKMPRLSGPLEGASGLTPVGLHEGKSVRYEVYSGAGSGLGGG